MARSAALSAVTLAVTLFASRALAEPPIEYEIRVACGTQPIYQVSLGMVVSGATLANFGPGCTDISCAGVSTLGETVNPDLSFAVGPNLVAPPGVREDTLYFHLAGRGQPDNRICSPFQDLPVARVLLNAPPAANFTTEGVVELGMTLVSDANGQPLPPDEYAYPALDDPPFARLFVEPAANDTSGRRWQVELASDISLAKITFGLVASTGTTTEQMRFVGCTSDSAPPATKRTCAAHSELGPYVAPSGSFTIGRQTDVSGLRTDTLYVSVIGARPTGLAHPALNVPGLPVALGIVELDSTAVQPALTLFGVATETVFGTPVLRADGLELPLQLIAIGGGYNPPSDFDADGRSDDLDNCPFSHNPDQQNAGGFLTTEPDFYGDACQCGDQTSDGLVFAEDLAAMRSNLAMGLADVELVLKCSVIGGTQCDIRDAVRLARNLAGLGPTGPLGFCRAAVRYP